MSEKYVRDMSGAELCAHMRRLQAMPGWHDPLSDSLYAHILALEAERDALRKDRERYQWLANRVLGCDYGDNDAPGQQNGWRIVHDLLAHNGQQPAFMYGTSIDAAIDAAIAAKEP